MTDYQEDKLGMYEKVLAFLTTFATELTGVSQIADIKTELEKNIDDITDAEGVLIEDTTGYTIEKANARKALLEITLKVSRAAAGYFFSIGKPGKIKASDYTLSELDAARDNDLYAQAKHLFKLADPVSANLSSFNSGPADVADLDTKKEAFFDIIELPASKRGEKTASVKDIDTLMSETDELLDGLDIYLDTFATVNVNMFNQYKSARAIDLSGGGSGSQRQADIVAGSIGNAAFGANQIQADSVLEFGNIKGNVPLTFYFATNPTSPVEADRPSVTLDPGQTQQIVATDAGFDATHQALNIYNSGSTTGKWKVRLLD